MNIREFDELIGQGSYVRCKGKKRSDSAIVSRKLAEAHIRQGGQIGWWVRGGYIVVDIDEGKQEALDVVKALGIKTLMMKTPKGLHLYFKTDKDFPQKVGMILPCGLKCDFRCANKGYVVLPFGSKDRVFNKRTEIAELPMEMTPMMGRKESLLNLKEGDGRNATLFSHLMAYKNRGANDEQIREMAYIINDIVFDEGMKNSELDKIIENTGNYEAQIQFENPYLIYNSKGQAVQVNNRAVCDYFVNEGGIFVMGGECYRYSDGIYKEASSAVRNEMREMIALDKFITQKSIMGCFNLLIDDVRILKQPSDIDNDVNLINFKNGVWNIEEGRLMPHDKKYLQTIQIPHEVGDYVPFQETRLYAFFKKTKIPKEDIKMILKYMAYCLTLSYGLKTFMVILGKSNTGKSVLIRFIENLVGKHNTSALSMHELNMRFYPAQLYGRLVNACADNNSLPLQSIDNLKKITGGDQIMCERKGKEPFFFVPFAKLIFSFNQMPLQLEEKSNAFYKRMRILSMENELFLNDAYVKDLCENGVAEVIPYLLKLLPVVEIPRTSTSNTLVENLREDSDSIHAFITQQCKVGIKYRCNKTTLYESYLRFCEDLGREAHKKQAFIRNLKAQGFEEERGKQTKGRREYLWKGITLKEF